MGRIILRQKDAFEADQVEAIAIRNGVASVASSALDDRITGEARDVGSELDLDKPPLDWNDEENGLEELSGRTLDAIRQRQNVLGEHYPFSVDRSEVSYVPSKMGVYEFCLATCLATSNPAKSHRQLLRHFERLACDLVSVHFGNAFERARFGWPSEQEFEEVPQGFSSRLDWMRKRCGFHPEEWTLQQTPMMAKYATRMKDARIDFVIRCSLLDDRPGGLTVIGQCGCGKHDVDDSSRKFEELSEEWLNFFFATTGIIKPVKLFATSQHLADDFSFYVRQGQSNSLFVDRIRLTLMASMSWKQVGPRNQHWIEKLTKRVL